MEALEKKGEKRNVTNISAVVRKLYHNFNDIRNKLNESQD
jgi:hypothetical protein